MGYGRAIVSDGWKYIAVRFPEDVLAEAAKTGRRPTLPGAFNDRKARNPTAWPSFGEADQLFDLRADPLEQKNLEAIPPTPRSSPRCKSSCGKPLPRCRMFMANSKPHSRRKS